MSTAAERAAATAAKFARPVGERAGGAVEPAPDTAPRPDDDPQVPAARSGRPPRTDPIRHTVDVMPADHRWLEEWEADTAWQLGVKSRDVSHQLVHESLLREMKVDATMQRKVFARIAERVQSERKRKP
jgi:hypothetical protein